MNVGGDEGVRWKSVALGWLVAILVGTVVSPILTALYGLVVDPPVKRGEFTATVVVISLVSGFLAYLPGGYVAGRSARCSGGLNGAMTAVFGLILGVILAPILAVLGATFPEGVAVPPASFGLIGEALLAGLILFLVNLFGGYIGGKFGEPPQSLKRRYP